MKRTWKDELGRAWDVEVLPPGDLERGDAALYFTSGGTDERTMPVIGPLEDVFADLSDSALRNALDATASGEGILLVEADGVLWWVHGPEDEAPAGGWTVKFSDGVEEHFNRSRLSDAPEDLSEDELLELLDEARGRVMEEMDVSQAS